MLPSACAYRTRTTDETRAHTFTPGHYALRPHHTTLHTLFLSPSLTFPVTDIYVHFLCPPLRVSLSRNRPAGEERERQNYWGTKRALRHCTAVRALGTAASESEAPTPQRPLGLVCRRDHLLVSNYAPCVHRGPATSSIFFFLPLAILNLLGGLTTSAYLDLCL